MKTASRSPGRADLRARTEMTALPQERTVLRMRKEDRQKRWPYEEFNRLLDQKMVQAGIPLTSKGTPNTVAFEEMTGVSPGRLHYWRSGYNQPTLDSLRQVAEGLAPHTGDDPEVLLQQLEVAAGKRSAQAPSETPASLEGKIERVDEILKSKSLTRVQRAKYRSMRASYDRAYGGMMDQLIEEFERDLQGVDEDHSNE